MRLSENSLRDVPWASHVNAVVAVAVTTMHIVRCLSTIEFVMHLRYEVCIHRSPVRFVGWSGIGHTRSLWPLVGRRLRIIPSLFHRCL